MEWYEALILGLIQGLTEFLPVSSSGHIEIGKALFGVDGKDNLYFSILVHGATVLSTIIVFRKDILELISGLFKFSYNEETSYISKIIVSMIPVAIVGLFLKDYVEAFYNNGNIAFVGIMLFITASLLVTTMIKRKKERSIGYIDAFIIGIAQAFAVIPGISRSGATISTGILLGNKKAQLAKFSFLMVLIPILGENFLELVKGDFVTSGIPISSLLIAFLAAFISGLLACKAMVNLVKKGKIYWFAIYCIIMGLIAILFIN
jgi:undecaprenyl-diphosphatase